MFNKLSKKEKRRLRRQQKLLEEGKLVTNPMPQLADPAYIAPEALDDELADEGADDSEALDRWFKDAQRRNVAGDLPSTSTTAVVYGSENVATASYKYGNGKYTKGMYCTHKGLTPALDFGKTKIHAAARFDSRGFHHDAALIIDLTGNNVYDSALVVPTGYESLLPHAQEAVPCISVDWPDHGLPPVEFSFWPELVRLLPEGKVLVRCVGGHGRTGTALAALMIVAWNYDAQKAIETVRKHHCTDAIETVGQRNYLSRLVDWWRVESASDADIKAAVTMPHDDALSGVVVDMPALLDNSDEVAALELPAPPNYTGHYSKPTD